MTPEERAHELGLLRESDGMLNQREVFLLEEIDRTAAEVAELKAQCAAMLEKAATVCGERGHSDMCLCDWCNRETAIRALIPTDYAAALAEVKRQARLEERRNHNYFYMNPSGTDAETHKAGFYYCLCGWEGPDRDSYWNHVALRAEGAKQP